MEFRKSSFCSNEACVEVAQDEFSVVVKDPEGHWVGFSHNEWRAFLLGVKAGEFDLP